MEYIQVIGGLVLLVIAGDMLVGGAVSMAYRLGISKVVIGLTVVAFGTSAPELVVGLDAALAGAPTLALGNVVGSNTANILLVMGLPAIIFPFSCFNIEVRNNYFIMLISSVIFILLCFTAPIGWWQGSLLLILLFGYLFHSYRETRKTRKLAREALEDVEGVPEKPLALWKSIVYLLGGLVGLIYGAHILVEGAVVIAVDFGIPKAVIGLTIVAIGTSLPELMTVIMAAKHNHGDVAFGNVIGSNIFNLFAIMGATAITTPVPVPQDFLTVDLWVMLAASLALLPFAIRDRKLSRSVGVLLTLGYIGYLVYLGQHVGL
ncbi:calcium/sodium antiporter [Emcibacter sp.]|uniref:calcium/sodium antiporter n=1 Tax=Emcibacter sp. TaxID=1979954 RepID=UPI002AA6F377|nr:calcium/sodium antiporter [Emcibacter sp.]